MAPYAAAWFGGAGTTTQAHYDVQHNLFCQLAGHKSFLCFAPDDGAAWLHTPANPLADLWAPAFEGGLRYPTRLLGIPLINFVAWFVFVFVYALQFRAVESQMGWSHTRKALVLGGLVLVNWPVLSFLLITPNL